MTSLPPVAPLRSYRSTLLEESNEVAFGLGQGDVDRFWSKVSPEPNTGCWLWAGSACRLGYGNLSVGRRKLSAHRVSYALAFGPIAPSAGYHGLCVCHRCDVPSCVNPAHLFLGTHTDNMRDMRRKGRWVSPPRCPREKLARGERAGGPVRLSEHAVLEIRRRFDSGQETLVALGRAFGVSDTLISRIGRRLNWAHVAEVSS